MTKKKAKIETEKEELVRRLSDYIEYYAAISRFPEVAFFKQLKAYIEDN